MLSSYVCSLLLCASTTPNIIAQSTPADIYSPSARAECALVGLQHWYNDTTGIWETAGWWNSANVMTTVGDLAQADIYNVDIQVLAQTIFADALHRATSRNPQPCIEDNNGTFAQANSTRKETGYEKYIDPKTHQPYTIYPMGWLDAQPRDRTSDALYSPQPTNNSDAITSKVDPHDWLDGFYDDDLWWALAWINAYDVTKKVEYLYLAEGIFTAVVKTWGTRCFNGGLWWSWKKDYMNAIANELFMSTAAHLANRVSPREKGVYLNWAERSLDWFLNSGMINEGWTINDGLTYECENNDGAVWSYNQGVIIGALVELHRASSASAPDDAYLTVATNIAIATLDQLSDENGVIHDGCEFAPEGCGPDASQFKGIFMRNLQRLHAVAPDDAFEKAIRSNAESIWKHDREGGCEGYGARGASFSVNWAGPFTRPANATTHSSAMDTLVAALAIA